MIPEQEKDIVKWYVVGISSVHQELRVRNDLRQAGMESYVPLSYEMKMINGRCERKLVPTITGLVFVRTSFNLFKDYAMGTSSRIYLRKSSFSNKEDYLTVSDQDMQRFIDVTTAYLENISYFKPNEVTLHAGELVEIQIGSKTYQAEIKRIKGKRGKRLVVEIPEVAMAAITITPELMKTITRLSDDKEEKKRQQRENARCKNLVKAGRVDMRKTTNLELDKKEMTRIALRLLFDVTADHLEDPENRIAKIELRRLYERLKGVKGVISSQEGELALAMYLSSIVLDIDIPQAEARMRNAISQLKDASILKLRLSYYLAKMTNDTPTLQGIMEEVKTWNKLRLSARQKSFWEEIR